MSITLPHAVFIYDENGNPVSDQSGSLKTVTSFERSTLDAFGRLRIASPKTLLDGKLLYGDRATEFAELATGGGTSSLNSYAPIKILSVPSGSTGSMTRQSKWYTAYQAGKSQQIMASFCMSTGSSGSYQRVGYFDNNNGIFFEKQNENLYLVLRHSSSTGIQNNSVSQSSWNIDKLDGSGSSTFVFNHTASHIFFTDFEWLGVGSARVGFVIDGEICYAHRFDWANEATGTFMATPSLPVRWEVSKSVASGPVNIDAICCSVNSEAGTDFNGWDTSVDRGISTLAFSVPDGTVAKPLISIRNKTSHVRMTSIPKSLHSLCTTNSNAGYRWALLLNPTITGGAAASWVSAGSGSGIEYDISRTGTVTDGVQVASGYSIGTSVAELQAQILPLGADISGTADEYVLVVQQLAAGAESFVGGIRIREIY